MATETIDGTIETATLKKANSKTSLYDSIVFKLADGSERRLEKVAAAPSVAEALKPGVQGRFYTYSAIDHKGIVAVRTQDGRSAFAIPSGNEKIMLMAAIAGAAWFAIALVTRGGIAVLALVLGVGGTLGYLSYRKTRIESKARYDADAGGVAAAPAAS